jgi:DNA-binding MarR family transcriptional regulator
MSCDWHKVQVPKSSAAAALPPAMVEETGWDILLALHSDRGCDLSLEKLASLVSASETVLGRWLAALEKRQLITGATDSVSGQVRALLTTAGRELLDRYLKATTDLQVGAPH